MERCQLSNNSKTFFFLSVKKKSMQLNSKDYREKFESLLDNFLTN